MLPRVYVAVNWLFSAVLLVFAGVLVLLGLGQVTLYSVQSGSMYPTLGIGDLVIAVPSDAQDFATGDVLTVDDGSGRVTHRVVASELVDGLAEDYRMVVMRGDNNLVDDPQPYVVKSGDKMVASVPHLGSFIDWLGQGWNRWAVIAALGGVTVLGSMASGKGKRRGRISVGTPGVGRGFHARSEDMASA